MHNTFNQSLDAYAEIEEFRQIQETGEVLQRAFDSAGAVHHFLKMEVGATQTCGHQSEKIFGESVGHFKGALQVRVVELQYLHILDSTYRSGTSPIRKIPEFSEAFSRAKHRQHDVFTILVLLKHHRLP